MPSDEEVLHIPAVREFHTRSVQQILVPQYRLSTVYTPPATHSAYVIGRYYCSRKKALRLTYERQVVMMRQVPKCGAGHSVLVSCKMS